MSHRTLSSSIVQEEIGFFFAKPTSCSNESRRLAAGNKEMRESVKLHYVDKFLKIYDFNFSFHFESSFNFWVQSDFCLLQNSNWETSSLQIWKSTLFKQKQKMDLEMKNEMSRTPSEKTHEFVRAVFLLHSSATHPIPSKRVEKCKAKPSSPRHFERQRLSRLPIGCFSAISWNDLVYRANCKNLQTLNECDALGISFHASDAKWTGNLDKQMKPTQREKIESNLECARGNEQKTKKLMKIRVFQKHAHFEIFWSLCSANTLEIDYPARFQLPFDKFWNDEERPRTSDWNQDISSIMPQLHWNHTVWSKSEEKKPKTKEEIFYQCGRNEKAKRSKKKIIHFKARRIMRIQNWRKHLI